MRFHLGNRFEISLDNLLVMGTAEKRMQIKTGLEGRIEADTLLTYIPKF